MGHMFIFKPGQWEGEGIITLSMSKDVLPYRVSWMVSPHTDHKILLHQIVSIPELDQVMTNKFCVNHASTTCFEIELSNQIVCGIKGKGVIDQRIVAWEFRQQGQDFEGFEIYRLQSDGSYEMQAEYSSSDGMRTHIEGHLEQLKIK